MDTEPLNKQEFWKLTHSKGMNSQAHARFWFLYCGLTDSAEQERLISCIEALESVRNGIVYF